MVKFPHDLLQTIGEEKKRLVEVCVDEIERGLSLLGASAIEDRLQDGVPDTIEHLRTAGIKVHTAVILVRV